MKIRTQLKFGEFVWDQENERLLIFDEYGNRVVLRKTYIFSLMRFCVRITQKYFNRGIRSRKKFEAKQEALLQENEIQE